MDELAEHSDSRERGGPATSGSSRTRKVSTKKLWLFRIGSICLGCVLVLALEGGLRLCGIGRDLRLVVPVPGHPEELKYQLNPLVDLAYYGGTNVTGPEPRRFDLPKPRGVYRIVLLGESTVIGFPYNSEVAFPRHVEVLLRLQNPELQFEVLNAGITSMNSFAVADLAEQCLACDPDLIVVHAGHNEFYGPGGPASTAFKLPAGWLRCAYAIRRWRLSQLLMDCVPTVSPGREDLMDRLPSAFEIPMNGTIFRQAEANYRANLQRIVQVAESAKVPLILSTVGCNLRGQGPLRYALPAALSDDERQAWEQHMTRCETALLLSDFSAALEALAQAQQICPDNARLAYRCAQCQEGLGEYDLAFQSYERARDLDGCRFRAPTSFGEVVREIATQPARRGVHFLDIAAALHEHSAPLAPGGDLFLEHVHYTFPGHCLLGRLFAKFIQERVRNGMWRQERSPGSDAIGDLLGVVPEDHLAADSLTMLVLETDIMEGALNAENQHRRQSNRITEDFRQLTPLRREVFSSLSLSDMETNLVGHLAQAHAAHADDELALEMAQRDVVRRPDAAEAWLQLAKMQLQNSDTASAEESLSRVLRRQPMLKSVVQALRMGEYTRKK